LNRRRGLITDETIQSNQIVAKATREQRAERSAIPKETDDDTQSARNDASGSRSVAL
jgi:hypothetical protein